MPLNKIPLIKVEESSNEDEYYISFIDDSKRKNATICIGGGNRGASGAMAPLKFEAFP